MAVLFSTNERIMFRQGLQLSVITSASRLRPGADVPYAIGISQFKDANLRTPIKATSTNEIYIQLDVYWNTSPGTSDDGNFMQIWDENQQNMLFEWNMVEGKMGVEVFGDTTEVDRVASLVDSFDPSLTTQYKIKLKVDGTEVACELYENGVLKLSASAANTGGLTIPRVIEFDNNDFHNSTLYMSNVIVTDTDLQNFGMFYLEPAAFGTDQDFSGSSVSSVTDDDKDTGITATATGEQQSFDMPTYDGGNFVHSYVANAVMTAGNNQNVDFKFYLSIGGTRYYGDLQTAPQNTMNTFQQEWDTDPSTGLAWTEANINAAEVGIEIF